MRNRYKFILVLSVTCTILSLCLASVSFSMAVKSNNKQEVPTDNVGDFDKLFLEENFNYFDVSDFAEKEINKVNIASKKYKSNTITVTDSDFKISEELSNKIYKTIKDYGNKNSFYMVSLDDGMTVGYNVDSVYETASSIKAPYALYVYKEIAAGRIDRNHLITYKEKHENKGTGSVKNNEFGTQLTVEELVYYSLHESDNVAHIMLHDEFGVKGYNNMLKKLGTKQLYLSSSNPWGFTSPRSAALLWQDIYNFSITNEEGIEFLNILSNVMYNYYDEVVPNIPSASKAGFAKKSVVVTGIIFDEHPYIAISVANTGGNISTNKQVINLIRHMDEIMTEYENYLKTKEKTS